MTLGQSTVANGPALFEADVLIVGGGPAAACAAHAAAESEQKVVLADKGHLGTSGATVPSNTGTWCVAPGEDCPQVVERRWQRTAGVAGQRWMLRLAEWGYPFPKDAKGDVYIANLRGPDSRPPTSP